jgi:hypothetical protein
MKQTAVEWFANRLTERGLDYSIEDFEQAKEMEKQQIIDAYKIGNEEDVYYNPLKDGEQYYNEKFKTK